MKIPTCTRLGGTSNDIPTTSSRKRSRTRDERGEGVISLAIGVLIMAALGVGMWKAFDGTMKTAQKNVDDEVTSIQPAP